MNTKSSWLGLGLGALSLLLFGNLASASPEGQPVITSVRLEGTNVVVTVQVPAGVKRVTLECRGRLGAGNWVPRALTRRDGAGGEVTFRLPQSASMEVLRVRTDDREPLPASYYSGTNSFAGQPVSSGGLGPVFEGPGDARSTDPTVGSPSRDVVESDIWNIRGNTLYFFNQYRGLQIIDISNPDTAAVTGTLALPAAGDQMYLLGDDYAVLLAHDGCGWSAGGPESQALIVGVKDHSPQIVATLPVKGYIQESRLIGTALYIASQAYRPLAGSSGGWEYGILVSGFDLSDPKNPVAKNTLWYSGYANAVAANDVFLFVVSPLPNNWWQSVVHCVDITAPDGALRDYVSIQTAGQVRDKFKLNWSGSTFTAISQSAASGRTVTKLETFHLPHPLSLGPGGVFKLGQLELGVGEQLFGTRFDGERVYVVTFFTRTGIDPLWIVDLSDASHPRITGELVVPGFSTYLHPLGDRLVAIGAETNRTTVSLFDVADATKPGLLSRVSLGERFSWSEANFNEKAFNVLPDAGLILVPFSGSSSANYIQAIQLVDLKRDALQARGVIEHEFQPRRATLHRDRIVSISGLQLLSVDAGDRDRPAIKGELELAWSVDRLFLVGNHLLELTTGSGGWWRWGGDRSGPAVRVTLAADPNKIVKQLEPPKPLPILGAAVRDRRLYVAQGKQDDGPMIYDAGDPNGPPAPTNSTLFLAVYDVSALPDLKLLGQTEATISSLGWGATFQPVWPKPGVLVWAGGGGGYWDPWLTFGLGRPVADGPVGIRRPYYWGGNSGRLIAFDVSDATAPKFFSDVNLAVNEWWNFSPAYTLNGLVYLSHQAFVKPTPIVRCDDTGKCWTNTPPDWIWVQRWYLDGVDYADPKEPVVRNPVNIPGTLEGVSHGGELLYTAGPHWKTDTNWWYDGPEFLDASAYDGIDVHLIDSLELSRAWPHPVLVKGDDIFVGRPTYANDAMNLIEAWTLSAAGKFTQLGKAELPQPAQNLVTFGNLLAVQSYYNTRLFDVTNPGAPSLLGTDSAASCLWSDLNNADGALDRGLWIPLGIYGVKVISIPPKP